MKPFRNFLPADARRTARCAATLFCLLLPLLIADRLAFMFCLHGPILVKCRVTLFLAIETSMVGLVPLLLFGRPARFFYAIAMPLEFAFICVEWFASVNFDMVISGSWVGTFLTSSPEEIRSFLALYCSPLSCVALVAIALVCVGLVQAALRCTRNATASWLTRLAAVGICLVWLGVNLLSKYTFVERTGSFPALALLPDSVRQFSQQRALARMATSPHLPSTIQNAEAEDASAVGVFVLGESATRSRWSLYGYARQTTPELDKIRDELTVFGDLVTTASYTSDAMRDIFTTRTLERADDLRFSLPQALRACGRTPALYTSHRRWDFWDSDETRAFAGCDPFVCLAEQNVTNDLDGAALAILKKRLVESSGGAVVFLHLYGSHIDFVNYPSDRAPFGRAAGVVPKTAPRGDRYDDTIWYTDAILGEVVRSLKALRRPAWMIYLSDHGETPAAERWRVATVNDLWEVPFVVWTSPEFNAQHPERVAALRRAKDRPLQSDQLFYGLLRFMGVEGLGNAPEDDFLDDAFKPRSPRLILNGSRQYEKSAKTKDQL